MVFLKANESDNSSVFANRLPSIEWLDSHESVASIPLNKSLGILARKIRAIPYLYPLKFEHGL